MKMAFDLHGVVMYLLPAMKRYFKDHVGFELEHTNRFSFPYPEWYNPSRFGPDIAQAIKMYAKDCKPMRGAIQALERFYEKTKEPILFVTASAESTMDTNIEWLDKHLAVPYTIVRCDHAAGKTKTLLDLGVTHYVDDRFKTCNDLADHLVKVYLFDDVHNRGRETKANVQRVRSLSKVVDDVTAMLS